MVMDANGLVLTKASEIKKESYVLACFR